MNSHHAWMVRLLVLVVVLDLAFGAWFGLADRVGVWNGFYFAVTTVTTVGYGDIAPHGWQAHLAAIAIMVLIIPLWSGSFSLLGSGLVVDRVDLRHEQMKEHISDRR